MRGLDTAEAQRAITMARGAQHELGLTLEAFRLLREKSLERLVNSAPEETALRDRLIVTVQILDAVKESLMNTVENGEAALNLIEAYNTMGTHND